MHAVMKRMQLAQGWETRIFETSQKTAANANKTDLKLRRWLFSLAQGFLWPRRKEGSLKLPFRASASRQC
jgi:hypothetical protein